MRGGAANLHGADCSDYTRVMAANGGFERAPKHVDTSRANPARCYDYWLGGSANFSVDRELADEMIRREPNVVHMARENRSFLGRVVRWCVDNGITQFLDLGSGIPTVGNVHEIAQQRDASACVAYVDNEPVAVAHSQQLLAGNPRATITSGDLREPEQVLSAPTVREVLDFDRPIALLAVMMLHYFQDDEVLISTLAKYRNALPQGSYLVLTHLTEDDPEMDMSSVAAASTRSTHPAHTRTREQFRTLFDGTELVDPGIVFVHQWKNPDEATAVAHNGVYGAVGRIL